ncbi:MAG: cobaltochelatase CobT-related protein, partial [Actinomycetes bacterium]
MELSATVLRALSGDAALHFRGDALYRADQRVIMPAPHLHPHARDAARESFRGAADGMALRLLNSDREQHGRLRPDTAAAGLVFDMLEQFRVEALADPAMPGVRNNLHTRFRQWTGEFEASALVETELGLLVFTVAQVCRARITAEPVPADLEDRIESTRIRLAPGIGPHLAALRRERFSQENFARHALAVAEAVEDLCGPLESATGKAARPPARLPHFQLIFDQDNDDEQVPTAGFGRSKALLAGAGGYRAFTTAYDRQFPAAGLVRAELLRGYRQQLDDDIAGKGINVPRLGRSLASLLAVDQQDGWEDDALEGRLDGSRLVRLVTSAGDRRVFRTDRIRRRAEARVTFLVDCSGSMKEHSPAVAGLVDVYARALELAGARCEVLGFTTAAWNGGRAARDWARAGKPPYPGRLNEVRHLVFKDGATSWRRARPGIAALLKRDLFREGVDGEAVNWAAARLAGDGTGSGDAHRRLLLVVSDGSPMDGATALANDSRYLEHHHRDAVAAHEAAGSAEIFGIGVGLDLSPYYRRNVSLDLSDGLTPAVVNQVLGLLARKR